MAWLPAAVGQLWVACGPCSATRCPGGNCPAGRCSFFQRRALGDAGGTGTVRTPAQIDMLGKPSDIDGVPELEEPRQCLLQDEKSRPRTSVSPLASGGLWKEFVASARESVRTTGGSIYVAGGRKSAPAAAVAANAASPYNGPPSSGSGDVHGQAATSSRRRDSAPPPRRTSEAGARAGVGNKGQRKPGRRLLEPSLASALPRGGLSAVEVNECLPRPPNSDCWDWPLTRHEKKARLLMIDRHVLMVDRQSLESVIEVKETELEVLRGLDTAWNGEGTCASYGGA